METKRVSIAQLAADPNYPFTEPSLRWLVHCAESNGLAKAKAVLRVGRRVYIDLRAFDQWLISQQGARA